MKNDRRELDKLSRKGRVVGDSQLGMHGHDQFVCRTGILATDPPSTVPSDGTAPLRNPDEPWMFQPIASAMRRVDAEVGLGTEAADLVRVAVT